MTWYRNSIETRLSILLFKQSEMLDRTSSLASNSSAVVFRKRSASLPVKCTTAGKVLSVISNANRNMRSEVSCDFLVKLQDNTISYSCFTRCLLVEYWKGIYRLTVSYSTW